jgi:hypothetical protein
MQPVSCIPKRNGASGCCRRPRFTQTNWLLPPPCFDNPRGELVPFSMRQKAFHGCAVPALANGAHAAADPVPAQQARVLVACMLGSPVRMSQKSFPRQLALGGHLKGIHHQPARHPLLHGPANNPPRIQVLHSHQVSRVRDVGDISDPGLVGPRRIEPPVQLVFRQGHGMVGIRGEP